MILICRLWINQGKGGNMNRKQYIFMLILAIIGGLIGGGLSSGFLIGKQAFALDKNKKNIIEANEFRVVDENGNSLGYFGARPDPAQSKGKIAKLHLGLEGQEDHEWGMWSEVTASGLTCESNKIKIGYMYGGFYIHKIVNGKTQQSFGIGTPPPWDLSEHIKIKFLDEKSTTRLELGLHKSGQPYLALMGDDGNIRAALGQVELQTKDAGSIISRSPASLVLFDKKGNVIWSTPE
jgi:hypothetical protein